MFIYACALERIPDPLTYSGLRRVVEILLQLLLKMMIKSLTLGRSQVIYYIVFLLFVYIIVFEDLTNNLKSKLSNFFIENITTKQIKKVDGRLGFW